DDGVEGYWIDFLSFFRVTLSHSHLFVTDWGSGESITGRTFKSPSSVFSRKRCRFLLTQVRRLTLVGLELRNKGLHTDE
ncbi:UNVERIFIED_CONTAM: hypothetical protein Sindi_3065700, partial [Sesamum indicum]